MKAVSESIKSYTRVYFSQNIDYFSSRFSSSTQSDSFENTGLVEAEVSFAQSAFELMKAKYNANTNIKFHGMKTYSFSKETFIYDFKKSFRPVTSSHIKEMLFHFRF